MAAIVLQTLKIPCSDSDILCVIPTNRVGKWNRRKCAVAVVHNLGLFCGHSLYGQLSHIFFEKCMSCVPSLWLLNCSTRALEEF